MLPATLQTDAFRSSSFALSQLRGQLQEWGVQQCFTHGPVRRHSIRRHGRLFIDWIPRSDSDPLPVRRRVHASCAGGEIRASRPPLGWPNGCPTLTPCKKPCLRGRVCAGSPNGIRTRREPCRPVRLVVLGMVARGKRSVQYCSVTSCMRALVGQSVGQKQARSKGFA